MLENIKNFNSTEQERLVKIQEEKVNQKKKNSILKKINLFVKNFINFL
jgi:hypothetical protein